MIDGGKYSNVMPSHSFLTDKQIADVLTYVRNSFGNKAAAITNAEVTATRIAKTHSKHRMIRQARFQFQNHRSKYLNLF
jgi:hypothetical protein